MENRNINNELLIKIKNIKKPLHKVTSKDIYISQIFKVMQAPISINTWLNIFPFLEKLDWEVIYKLPFRVTREPYLQSFQYKIINRILNCNDKLFTWQIIDSRKCIFCSETDTIEHHLYGCVESRKFWCRVEKWLADSIEIKFHFTECEILYGIPIQNDERIEAINYTILLGKWFINKNRSNNKSLYFIEFLHILKNKISTLIESNRINNYANKNWLQKLYT